MTKEQSNLTSRHSKNNDNREKRGACYDEVFRERKR